MKVCYSAETAAKWRFATITDPAYSLIFLNLCDIMNVEVNASILLEFESVPTFWVLPCQVHRINSQVFLPRQPFDQL